MTSIRVMAITVNLGRKYPPAVFAMNARRVMTKARSEDFWIVLPQELDEEPDPVNEHHTLGLMLPDGTKKVFWRSREPILLSPNLTATRRRRVLTMGSGEEIGGPVGTGPRRHAVSCVAHYRDLRIGAGNTHPHRRGLTPRVEQAREEGESVFGSELRGVRRSGGGTSGLWGADMNDENVPRLVPGERVAVHHGLDHLRYWEHPDGARIRLLDRGTWPGTIDPHDPLWALLEVTSRR